MMMMMMTVAVFGLLIPSHVLKLANMGYLAQTFQTDYCAISSSDKIPNGLFRTPG